MLWFGFDRKQFHKKSFDRCTETEVYVIPFLEDWEAWPLTSMGTSFYRVDYMHVPYDPDGNEANVTVLLLLELIQKVGT